MLKNYLKTTLRIMLRQKAYSAINIAGLSLGIAASLLIILYVVDELSFDKFQKDGTRTLRVGFSGRLQGNEFVMASSPAPVADAIMAEMPEAESAVRFGLWRTIPIKYGEKALTEENFLVADSNFFQFFSFPLISGDPKTALQGVNKVVVSEAAAKRYFGDENPIGKILLRGSEKTAMEVSGVAKDVPNNSHIKFDMVLSGESWEYLKSNRNWTSNNIYTYFKIHPNADVSKIKQRFDQMVITHVGPELEKIIGLSLKQFLQAGNNIGFFTQDFLDIHLKSNLREEITPNGNLQYLYIFGAIAVFIILIACINFMNLSTARSANRAKEVGVRKTIGAMRSKLIGQFISESLIYSFFSTALALVIIAAMMHSFNMLSGKSLTFSMLMNPVALLSLVAFACFVGLIAGSYPAFYLTSFKPVDVLKGKVRSGFKNSGLRNSLVVFQFMISIALILGSMVVYKQLKFMQEKNLGFNKENVVRLLHTWSLDKNSVAFKNELKTHPEFKSMSYANELPPHISNSNAFRKGGTEQDFLLQVDYVDYDHLETMQYAMADGRFFSRDFASDSTAIIINQAAFNQMGFKGIEHEFINNYNTESEKPKPMKLIGVMKDFNFESLRSVVKPMAFILGGERNGIMAIRLNPGNAQQQLQLLETIWKKFSSDAFEYTFLDQDFDALFRAEQRMSRIILIFTVLTIAIACLGLFGLATYVGEQRAKEISIRKVMGASMSQVMGLLFKDFTLLIVIAFVIAAPLGWYGMNYWLRGFAFHVSVDAWIVALAGASSLLIAIFTISFQSIKAARENPVKALKNE